jgi:hypothetical protein
VRPVPHRTCGGGTCPRPPSANGRPRSVPVEAAARGGGGVKAPFVWFGLPDRVASKIGDHGDCWVWTAATTNGYGVVQAEPGSRRIVRAHRLVYELLVSPIPDGLQLDHLCRNRACVNPEHLEPVTRKENILRGTAPSAVHARKEACPQGHPYDRTVTRRGTTERRCSVCERTRARAGYHRRKEVPR